MALRKNKSEVVKCEYFTWRLNVRDGVYQADGRSNSPPGGRHSLDTKLREQALETLQELDVTIAIQRGIAAPGTREGSDGGTLLLNAGRQEYLAFVARPRSLKGGSKSTQKRYRAVFDKAVVFFEKRGLQTWNEVTESEFANYISHLDKLGYAHATQVMEAVTLKQAFNYWIEKGLLPGEMGFKLEVDKVTESTTYCFTVAEVEAMIRHCRGQEHLTWLGNVIIGLSYSGMRIGELVQLRWSAVNIDRNMITIVDDSRTSRSRSDIARTTKNRTSRPIPIHAQLRATLQTLYAAGITGRVFRAQRGGPLHPRNVLEAFINEVINLLTEQRPNEFGDAGFATGRLHSLRHFFCSLCANEGVPERVLMTWLGHSDSAIVKRYYHLNNEEAQTQMSKLAKVFSA